MHSAKSKTPYRQVLMEKVQCPDCGKMMTIRTLHHRHRCKTLGPPPEKMDRMRAKATATAIEAHATRMMKLGGLMPAH